MRTRYTAEADGLVAITGVSRGARSGRQAGRRQQCMQDTHSFCLATTAPPSSPATARRTALPMPTQSQIARAGGRGGEEETALGDALPEDVESGFCHKPFSIPPTSLSALLATPPLYLADARSNASSLAYSTESSDRVTTSLPAHYTPTDLRLAETPKSLMRCKIY